MQARILLILIVAFFAGCSSAEDKAMNELKEKEAPFKDRDHKFDQKELRDVITAYEDFAQKFPKSENAPKTLYKASKLHISLNEFDAAIGIYQKLTTDYPEYNKQDVLFMQGYVYENYMHRMEKAKELYEKFLQLYPTHELADDVQFSLENLGKPAEEVIREKGWDKQEKALTDSGSGS